MTYRVRFKSGRERTIQADGVFLDGVHAIFKARLNAIHQKTVAIVNMSLVSEIAEARQDGN